uniref:Coiled-coil domain-containing protein 14-like n=1 Tax=Petromyzon marinus TaxID=7757 RepID=A0AAJ7SN80_PETMA|nr:coiled-coil domain-containing protein 14-like [Petromyzon marinus]
MKPAVKKVVRNAPSGPKTKTKVAKSEEKRQQAAKTVKNSPAGRKKAPSQLPRQGVTQLSSHAAATDCHAAAEAGKVVPSARGLRGGVRPPSARGLNHHGITVMDQSWLHGAKESSNIDQGLSQTITDRAEKSGNHIVEKEDGTNSTSHQVSPSKTHTVRELLVELKSLLTGQGEKVARLVKELEEKVPTLPSAVSGVATQADIALALLPLRSENIHLRRKTKEMNEELRRHERQPNATTAASDMKGLALHEKNSFLQKQLQESRKQAEQLEKEKWGLHEALQQQSEEHDRAAQKLQERERNFLCQKQQLEIELRRAESDLTDVHISVQNLHEQLEASDREKQILQMSLKGKEFEMTRMQDMIRALQHKMSLLLFDLDVNTVRSKCTHQDNDHSTWRLPEHEHTSYLSIAIGTNDNSSNNGGLVQRSDSTEIKQFVNNEGNDATKGATCNKGHPSRQKEVCKLFHIPNSPALLIETMVPERDSGVAVEEKEQTYKSPTTNAISVNERHRMEDSGLFTPSGPRVIRNSLNKEPYQPAGNVSFSKTQVQSALSDSLSTFSSFTTQDDQEFRNGLAVLDSNISRLQSNLRSEWLRK